MAERQDSDAIATDFAVYVGVVRGQIPANDLQFMSKFRAQTRPMRNIDCGMKGLMVDLITAPKVRTLRVLQFSDDNISKCVHDVAEDGRLDTRLTASRGDVYWGRDQMGQRRGLVMFGRAKSSVFGAACTAALLLSACATLGPEDISDSPKLAVGVGTPVPAAAETPPVGTGARDAADDPAIWVDPADRSRGVIIGTDKQAGIYVYDLAGKQAQYLPGGMPNNVDLREGFATKDGVRVLVAASDRGRPGAGAALFLLDPATLKLTFWAAVPVDLVEPYGLCLAKRGDAFLMIVNGTDGQVRQHTVVTGADGKPVVTEERRFAVATQPEGCVADDARGRLYLGEEGRGIWQFDLAATASPGKLIAEAPSEMLKPDVEGLALLDDGAATWLIASSQGDSAFAVWRVDGETPAYKGRFSVIEANGIDAVTGTDGVTAQGGRVGAFPEGLVVMQDDVDNGTVRQTQNFKLVDWREVKKALGL